MKAKELEARFLALEAAVQKLLDNHPAPTDQTTAHEKVQALLSESPDVICEEIIVLARESRDKKQLGDIMSFAIRLMTTLQENAVAEPMIAKLEEEAAAANTLVEANV